MKDTLQKPAQHDDEERPGQSEPESEQQPMRLTVHEYCCFMVAKFVNHLDAFARAKAAPKTKTYALDTDACEDPTVHRMPATEGMDISFEDVPEDADIDGYVRLKCGEAPEEVLRPLSTEQSAKAISFYRERTSKFVRDMIDVGLLPIMSQWDNRSKDFSADPSLAPRGLDDPAAQELQRINAFASRLPKPSKQMLDLQKQAFDPKARQDVGVSAEPTAQTHSMDDSSPADAQWQQLRVPSDRMKANIAEFEASVNHPDASKRGFLLTDDQKTMCKWFGLALDVAHHEETRGVPMNNRTQKWRCSLAAEARGRPPLS